MIKLIVGNKGTGKTKILIDMINHSLQTTSGNVICIEKGAKLTYDVDHSVRLIDAEHYNVEGYDVFFGFIAGLLAGNYDITEIYVDSILKIGGRDYDKLGELFEKVNAIAEQSKATIVFTVSADESELPESVKKFAK
ncbi:MAG: hypothetical protein K0R90_1679 [Oscillospiraceae bacterium]|jgi:hypothetical protein|nr:hypothetical protein [Oscillospiraceae bacterium]